MQTRAVLLKSNISVQFLKTSMQRMMQVRFIFLQMAVLFTQEIVVTIALLFSV